MYGELLQELGLSPNEAKIYEALVTYGGSGVSTIALRAKVHRRNVYDTVQRLLEKGLVYEVQGRGELVYEPVDPSKLLELVQEKARRVELALPSLMAAFSSKKAVERTYIYKGIEGVKNFMKDMLGMEQDIYAIGGKAAWFDRRLKTYTEWFAKELKRRGLKNSVLFDAEIAALDIDPRSLATRHKFLPEGYSTGSTIEIFGDHVVMYSGMEADRFGDDVTVFVTVDPALAEAYRTWWKLLWDLLPEAEKPKKKGWRR